MKSSQIKPELKLSKPSVVAQEILSLGRTDPTFDLL